MVWRPMVVGLVHGINGGRLGLKTLTASAPTRRGRPRLACPARVQPWHGSSDQGGPSAGSRAPARRGPSACARARLDAGAAMESVSRRRVALTRVVCPQRGRTVLVRAHGLGQARHGRSASLARVRGLNVGSRPQQGATPVWLLRAGRMAPV